MIEYLTSRRDSKRDIFFFSSRRRHTRSKRDWSSDVCSSDLGGFAVAEGYYTMQFAGVGSDYPVLNEIREMYKKEGKPVPKEMASTVFYNRGVLIAALHVEAIRNALMAKT